MTRSRDQLGEYLRARRAQVQPEEVDLPRQGARRVSGLRREEVASLAGLSVDYYTRLEQGRERHPSASVLNALARVLRLGEDAQRYLFAIATAGPRTQRRVAGAPRVSESLLAMIHEWPAHPTVLLDRCHNVVAANQLGRALYDGHRHGDNLVRLVFLDSTSRELFREWDKVASSSVAALRATAALQPDAADIAALIGELSMQSTEFAQRWAKADVRHKQSEQLLLHHPLVGELDLIYEPLRPSGDLDVLMKIYRAEPGSSTAERLTVLGSLTARVVGEDQQGRPAPHDSPVD